MRFWDYIFPDDKKIIIWGAGKKGKKWLGFIGSLNKHVDLFFDEDDKLQSVSYGDDFIPVIKPASKYVTEAILLISPINDVELIYNKAKQLGYHYILLGNALDFLPKYGELPGNFIFKPFGHYYSLYPDLREVADQYEHFINLERKNSLDEINMNDAEQLRLLKHIGSLIEEMPDWEKSKSNSSYRFKADYSTFPLADIRILYGILRLFSPKRLIEVGSGQSSAVTLDVNAQFLNNEMDITFIEPYPEILKSLIREEDKERVSIIERRLQDVPLEKFKKLKENDVLFIDSTHVSKFGSDVNYIIFHILPLLQKGVIVHFHDIFYPWEYPKEWIMKGMGWNELYLLRAFLQYNTEWEVLFFNDYIGTVHTKVYVGEFKTDAIHGGSFWMRKK